MNHWFYRLGERFKHYYDDVAIHIGKMVKQLEVQFKVQIFHRSDQITIFRFFPAFQMACGTNDIRKAAAMWLYHFFMKKPAGAALSAITCLTSSRQSHQEGK